MIVTVGKDEECRMREGGRAHHRGGYGGDDVSGGWQWCGDWGRGDGDGGVGCLFSSSDAIGGGAGERDDFFRWNVSCSPVCS